MQTLSRASQVGARLRQHRQVVIQKVQQLVSDMLSKTDEWYASCPDHVRAVLHPHAEQRFEPLVFTHLLQACGYEDAGGIASDLYSGLPLLGQLAHTPGWRPRTDDTYRFPISIQVANHEYFMTCLQKSRVDDEWRTMLTEVCQEVDRSKMEGPFFDDPAWPKATVPAASVGLPCLPFPGGKVYVARAFSVTQVGADGRKKVRRCEDYRRSYHNSTISVGDRPEHDDIEIYVQALCQSHRLGMKSCLWCQDLADAYRSYPVRDPSHAYMLLGTPTGPTLSKR